MAFGGIETGLVWTDRRHAAEGRTRDPAANFGWRSHRAQPGWVSFRDDWQRAMLTMSGTSCVDPNAIQVDMAIAWLVFRENVDSRISVGAVAIPAGTVLLSWHQGKLGMNWRVIAISGACVSWGSTTI
jgi:hypothetical protein